MTNFGHKIMLTVLVLLITPPLGFAAATVNASPLTQTSKVTVKGVVKDAAGAPLLGVTVIVKGTSVGTSTSIDGEYQIQCAADAELDFSFIGYETQTLPVANRTLLNVTLKEDAQLMDEVIVIGYGTTTRRRAVGAVDQIKSEAITERSVANLTQALQGTSPSLVIQQRSSDPADNQLNINIRGIGTMNNNEPLIVIDGLVSDNASFNKLNPSDIENVSVLKDAGTAAIYGSRAANGVLLVTTKKGKLNQAPTVELTAMVGWQQPEVLYTPVQGWQNATLLNISKANSGLAPAFTAEQIRDLKAHGNGTFYMDEILRTAMQQNYNVSVSGGGANTTYMISAGYYDQESNFEGPDYGRQRYNFRTNITTEYKRVKVTALLSYSHENSKTTTDGSTIANAMRIPTYYYYRQYDPVTGKYLLNDKLTDRNSLGLLEEGGYNKYRNDYVNANLSAEVKIIDGLKLRGVLGADIFADHRYTRTHEVMFYNTDAAGNPVGEGRSANNDNKSEDWNKRAYLINSQLMLDFDRTFGKHHVAALLGASNESYTSEANQISFKWADPDLGINGDGTIDENDRYYLGNAFPRYTLGFTYNVAWKGIDLSIFLQGVLKRDMMVRGELIEPFHSNYGYTMYEHQLDFWTPTNTDARWPRLTDISDPSNQNNYRMGSDLYMFDGSYLRLKNIQLGYTLPERISMKFGVKRFKIYFNAQNLLTFSNCSFIDPESSEFGSNMNSGGANSGRNYPNLRYFGAGLNITF